MNVAQYRKRIEQQVAKEAKAARAARSRKKAPRARASLKQRTAAIENIRFDGKDAGKAIRRLIEVLRNPDEPVKLRQAAFAALKTAAFLGPVFAPHRAAFLKCLREIATDPDPQIREDALETLAIEKVDYAQDLLQEGLKNPKKALVTPAKAIQFLAYDGHAEAAPLVRTVLARTKDAATKEAAIHFLSADPESAKVLAGLLKDKTQPARIRSLSATGLRVLSPQKFEKAARKIVEDGRENPALRATCLGALTFIRDYQKTRDDPAFVKRVARLESSARSRILKASAKRFMAKQPG